jgi:N-acetylmuramoyl-L-alanine amidase
MRWSNRSVLLLGAFLLSAATAWLVSAAPAVRAVSAQAIAPSPSPSQPPRQSEEQTEFFVMIDPSHGGDDNGATLGGKLLEKDVTLALARELRKELELRGISARLLRDSDSNLSLQRRAELTNQERAAVYIALHAGPPGSGVRVYLPLLPSTPKQEGRMLPWETAQGASLRKSGAVAQAVAHELTRTGLPVASLAAPLRPLNNLVPPAIAVEWATGRETLHPSENQKTLLTLALAIASGIARARGQLEGRP